MSITGFTSIMNLPVTFSSTQTLTQFAAGPAGIFATNPVSGAAVPITMITMTTPKLTEGVFLNPRIGGTVPVDTSIPARVTVVANEPGGGTGTFQFTYPTSGPGAWGIGNNFLTITTTNGETIANVTIDFPPRIAPPVQGGGFDSLADPMLTIPEPFGLTLAGVCLGGLALGARRRKGAS
jgi:hypothetical protein